MVEWGSAEAVAATSPASLVPVSGNCTFDTTGGDALTATFSPPIGPLQGVGSLSSIVGDGSCTSNVSSNTISLNLEFSSTWSCAGGAGFPFGGISWSDGVPGPEFSLSGAVAGGPSSIDLSIHDPTLGFEASASLVWSPLSETAAGCAVSGVSSTALTGVLFYTLA